VSGPVRTEFGVHLIKLTQQSESEIESFEDSRERIERDLGAHVLTLEDSGPYGETDFTDPLHLRRRRGRELGALVVRNAGTILAARGPADAAVSVDRPGQ
jgi:hypothetical protein